MKRFGAWTLVVLIAIMDFGYVRPGFAQTANDCILAIEISIEISGASGRSVCENSLWVTWTWTAPVTGPATFDTEGTDSDVWLTVSDGTTSTTIAQNFDPSAPPLLLDLFQ